MPIFEFECAECGKRFEELVRSANAVDEVVCPGCRSQSVRKKISTFAAKVSGGSASSYGASAAACSSGSL